MVAEAADVSRVIKVGEIGLCGVSGNGMGVWGELAVVWLCGCGGGVERQELLHNGRLHDNRRLGPDRAYRSQPCMPPAQRRRYLGDVPRYPSIQVPKYPSVLHASVAQPS